MHIRLATADDAADISALICAFSPVAPGTPGAEAFLYGFSTAGILEKVGNPADRVLLACENDQLAGVVSLHGRSKIGLFFVDRRFHGSGVGRMLFQQLEALERGAGYSGPWVVNADPGAVGFYEKLGFQINGPAFLSHGVACIPMRRDT